jgi:hypothetical protein
MTNIINNQFYKCFRHSVNYYWIHLQVEFGALADDGDEVILSGIFSQF